MAQKICIVGYGNIDRHDDGIGPYVAKRLTQEYGHHQDVRILSIHQLAPELIDMLQDADAVIFVDATTDPDAKEIDWQKVEWATDFIGWVTHFWNPSSLMGFYRAVYARQPEAYVVSVKGEDFNFGQGLSVNTLDRAQKAILVIKRYIKQGENR